MKIINNKYFKLFFTVLIMVVLMYSCRTDDPVPPQAGPFDVTHDIPAEVPAAGGTYNLTIDGSTNGWWIVKSANVSWLTINRLFGSAKVSQQITISANTETAAREVSLEINSTNKESKIIKIIQER